MAIISFNYIGILKKAMGELQDHTGTAFYDSASRKEFFDHIERYPYEVELGTAFSHAQSQTLSHHDNGNRLLEDCVRIMASEMRRWQFLERISTDFSIDEVRVSQVFNKNYKLARKVKQDAYMSLVFLHGGGELVRSIPSRPDFDIHEQVYDELRSGFPDFVITFK